MGVSHGVELPVPQCTVHPWHTTRVLLHGQRFCAQTRPVSMTYSDLVHFLHFPLLGFVGMWMVKVKGYSSNGVIGLVYRGPGFVIQSDFDSDQI